MISWEDRLIGGEAFSDVLDGLRDVKVTPKPDDMVLVRGDVGPAVLRAVMRIEAEFLIDDADALQEGEEVERDGTQRRADAFASLLRQVAIIARRRAS